MSEEENQETQEDRPFPRSEAGDLSKKKHGSKAPMWVINARVEYVTELLARSYRYSEIVKHLVAEWQITARMAEEYLKRGRILLEETAEKHRPDHLARHLKLREELLAIALDQDQPDVRAALAVADSEAKLLGLVQERHKHEGKIEHHAMPATPESIEEARKRLEEARKEQEKLEPVDAEVIEKD